VLVAFGVLVAWLAWRLPMGTWDRMGPGFLPACAAGGLVAAALAGLMSRRVAEPSSAGSVTRLGIAVTGVSGFALLADPAGGLLAAWFLSSAAALAAGLRPLAALRWGSALGPGSVLVFVHALDVPIPLWPSMIGR